LLNVYYLHLFEVTRLEKKKEMSKKGKSCQTNDDK